MSWRGDPSTAFSCKKNVAVEPNITNLQSTINRGSTLNPDKPRAESPSENPSGAIRSDLPPRVDPSFM